MKLLRPACFLSSVAQSSKHTRLYGESRRGMGNLFGSNVNTPTGEYPVLGSESLMNKKAHGSTENSVQGFLQWGCDRELADRICCFNRHYAEPSGFFEDSRKTSYLKDINREQEVTYYDSVTGKPLFVAPRGRSFASFLKESRSHGWPSFRDEEVVWENVRCLKNGEAVSVDGTHLGHNLPDKKGNRYCINLVSIAGYEKN